MELKIHAQNIEVTSRLQEHVERKVNKLDRYLPDIQEMRVDLSMERHRQGQDKSIAQLTLRDARGVILRSEEKRQPDVYAALDMALDKMYRQIRRYKGKRKRRGGGNDRYPEPQWDLVEPVPLEDEEESEEEKLAIVRRKHVELVPMTEEEAIDQMELLGHSFFIFLNAETAKMGVLYRREDGNYGVLEPDVS